MAISAKIQSERIAAVDLGSNSFHMIVARIVDRELMIVDRLKESVRLAAGLDAEGYLTEEAQERALACLERFSGALSGIPPSLVRAVGTNTLRRARNGRDFLSKARSALGYKVEVISGHEEARLIYLGVSHTIADQGGRRLVCDIGGGSTEFIIGTGFEAERTHSLYMGCVTWTQRYFNDGKITPLSLAKAELGALQELETIASPFNKLGWQRAIGSSGTMQTLGQIMKENGWSDGAINEDGLRELRKRLLSAGDCESLDLPGLKPERRPVIAGGFAIAQGIFQAFHLQTMDISTGALREGLLYDLLGRIRHEDRRDVTIEGFCDRFRIDREQANRVTSTALEIYNQLASPWEMIDDDVEPVLNWSARLHEIGQAVSYSGYHKHGEYLLIHSEMPGFSREDKELLATLVRTHRRKVSSESFQRIPPRWRKLAHKLCVVLRLAVVLNRSRSDDPKPAIKAKIKPKTSRLTLGFPDGWLERQPLTQADLEQEAEVLARLGVELRIK